MTCITTLTAGDVKRFCLPLHKFDLSVAAFDDSRIRAVNRVKSNCCLAIDCLGYVIAKNIEGHGKRGIGSCYMRGGYFSHTSRVAGDKRNGWVESNIGYNAIDAIALRYVEVCFCYAELLAFIRLQLRLVASVNWCRVSAVCTGGNIKSQIAGVRFRRVCCLYDNNV